MNGVLKTDIDQLVEKKELFKGLHGADILITGATGLIGSMLVRVLNAASARYDLDIKLIGLVRDREKAKQLFGELLVSNELILTESYDVKCSHIIHTISPTKSKFFIKHPVETISVSVSNTVEALETARRNGAAMIYLSSMEQYGVPYKTGQLMTEDEIGTINHLEVRSSYSESKRLCECLCISYVSEYGVDARIARLAQTFGAGMPLSDNRMPMQFAKAVCENRDIVLHTEGKSVSNFVYLTDALAGILTIIQKGQAGEAYNICCDAETRSVRQIAELVAGRTAGGKIQVSVDIPEGVDFGYAPDVIMYMCSGKLESLGWKACVDMEEAYSRLVRYINEEMNL